MPTLSCRTAGPDRLKTCLNALLLMISFQASLGFGCIAPAQEPAGETFRVKVDLVTVETVVLDKTGKPVRGLNKENFRLFEDGKEQQILTLDTMTCPGPDPAPLSGTGTNNSRGKTVLILFDDSTVGPAEIKTVRDAAKIYVRRHMGPSDWFAVAVFWRNLRITQNFTQEVDKVLEAIRRPASSMDTSPGSILARAGTIGALDLIRSLIDLTSSLNHTSGRKAVLLFTDDFPSPSHTHYAHLVDAARKAEISFFTLIARRASAHDNAAPSQRKSENTERIPAGKTPPTVINSLRSSAGSAMRLLALPNSPANFLGTSFQPQSKPREQSLPQVIGNAPLTPPTRTNTGDASNTVQYNDTGTGDCLKMLAEATGGDYVQESSDLVAALDSFEQGLCHYYLLGFQSSNPKRDGKMRKIEIRTDLKGIRLKYRPAYFDARPLDLFTRDKTEKSLLEAVSLHSNGSAVPFAFRAFYFYESAEFARVPILARIQSNLLGGEKKSSKSGPGAGIMGVALAEDGRIVARFSQGVDPGANPNQTGTTRAEYIPFKSYFRLHPGTYHLRLAVTGDQGKIGSAEETLTIPPRQTSGWSATSLILSQRVEPLPEIVRTMQAQLLDASDPFLFRGHQIIASIDNQFLPQQPLLLFYRLYGLQEDELNHSLVANIRLKDKDGVTHLLQPVTLNKVIQPLAPGEIMVGFSLSLADRALGHYQLIVETLDELSRHVAECQATIELR